MNHGVSLDSLKGCYDYCSSGSHLFPTSYAIDEARWRALRGTSATSITPVEEDNEDVLLMRQMEGEEEQRQEAERQAWLKARAEQKAAGAAGNPQSDEDDIDMLRKAEEEEEARQERERQEWLAKKAAAKAAKEVEELRKAEEEEEARQERERQEWLAKKAAANAATGK